MNNKVERLLNDIDGWVEDLRESVCAEHRYSDDVFEQCVDCTYQYGAFDDGCGLTDLKQTVSELRNELCWNNEEETR
jgi:hypothetical protein